MSFKTIFWGVRNLKLFDNLYYESINVFGFLFIKVRRGSIQH